MAEKRSGERVVRGEAQWRALLGRFSQSGLSATAFCRGESVSEHGEPVSLTRTVGSAGA